MIRTVELNDAGRDYVDGLKRQIERLEEENDWLSNELLAERALRAHLDEADRDAA